MAEIEFNTAKRIRHDYRKDNLYVIVNYDSDGFLESLDLCQTSDRHDQAETVSGLELVAALVNKLLALDQYEFVLTTAETISLGSRTLPGIIAKVLREHKGNMA
jgi:hypothetical protein